MGAMPKVEVEVKVRMHWTIKSMLRLLPLVERLPKKQRERYAKALMDRLVVEDVK